MKGKFLFAAALAALAVGCTQEELEAPVAADFDLSGRIGIQAPAMSLGNGMETRMTTDGNQAGVKWQENDGFGAMLVDQVENLNKNVWSEWDDRYTITDAYKSSNFLFRYNATTETFKTDAAMVEGNYVFYAPFNSKENTRNSLTIKTPTVQTITPDVLNSAVTKFYESGDPVFIAYKELRAESAETSIDVKMKHIFATPLITLTNKYTTTDGEGNTVKHDLTVTKVEFTYASDFMKEAKINNSRVRSIFRTGPADKNWQKNQHETAHTSDLYTVVANPKNPITTSKITVNMEGDGLKVAPDQSKQFAVILPAEDYGKNLKATVYVKIDGKETPYKFDLLSSAKSLCLNPGFPYPAQEYTSTGDLKSSKGTSATYTLTGTATDLSEAPVDPNNIRTEEDLINYINKVAYRGEDIQQVGLDVVIPANEAGTKFKITEKITLTDAFLNAVKNSLLVETTGGNVTGSVIFSSLAKLKSGKSESTTDPNDFDYNVLIQLGAITVTDRTLSGHVIYPKDAVAPAGQARHHRPLDVVGNYQVEDQDTIVVKSGTVTVPDGIQYTITNNGGTLNVAGAPDATSTITNKNAAVVNINGNTDGNLTINNVGKSDDPKKTSTINIAAGKTVKSVIENSENGEIYNKGYLYSVIGEAGSITNSGTIYVTDVNAGVKLKGASSSTNFGKICNNSQCPAIVVETGKAEIYCELTSVPEAIAANINTVNLSGSITFTENVFAGGKVFANVKTVNFANGTTVTSSDMNGTTLGVTFKFPKAPAKVYWNAFNPVLGAKIENFTLDNKTSVISGDGVTGFKE